MSIREARLVENLTSWLASLRAENIQLAAQLAAAKKAHKVPGKSREVSYLTFYTHAHEVSRTERVIEDRFSHLFRPFTHASSTQNKPPHVDFMWVHKPNINSDAVEATVRTHLSNVDVLEDKANLAYLQNKMTVPVLPTAVVKGKNGFKKWCSTHLVRLREVHGEDVRLWVVKDAHANGGEDIWVFEADKWELQSELLRMDPKRVYVIQKYVCSPLLWEGKYKFHFRVYALLMGDMRVYVYRRAFAHVANKAFTKQSDDGRFDKEIHITNVSQNVHDSELFHRYPIVDLTDPPFEFEDLHGKIGALFADLASNLRPFMQHQLSPHHMCHIGADLIPDTNGRVWLIEANCPPNLFAYTNNPTHPDECAIRPLCLDQISELITGLVLPVIDPGHFSAEYGHWDLVTSSHSDRPDGDGDGNGDGDGDGDREPIKQASPQELGMNRLAWCAYKAKCIKAGLGLTAGHLDIAAC